MFPRLPARSAHSSTSVAGLATPWLTPDASVPPAKNRPTGSALAVSTTSDPESPASLNWLPLMAHLVGVGLGQIGLGFSTVQVVIDGYVQVERRDAGTR